MLLLSIQNVALVPEQAGVSAGVTKKTHHATLIGSYAPRQCGIATFTQDLRNALLTHRAEMQVGVAAMMREPCETKPADEVVHRVEEQSRSAYGLLREELNASETGVVSLQHEYGIFGGPDGSWILDTLRGLHKPVVTTCHTVLANPSIGQRQVLSEIARLSARLVVMTEKARQLLAENYDVPKSKISLIPHGIPDTDVELMNVGALRREFGSEGRQVILTNGLLSPNKGIQHVIAALPAIVKEHPQVLYVLAGATHPDLVRREGEVYRDSLLDQARSLGVAEHVHFTNRFASREELVRMIAAADLFVTPYLNEAQITSGVLAYASGLGKPVISTPYWHAVELLADERGVIVPFADPQAIAGAVNSLLSDPERMRRMAASARNYGRQVTWRNTGRQYMDVFDALVSKRTIFSLRRAPQHVGLDHLHRLTGPLGIYQHAKLLEPDLDHGYCTDDNARALIAAQDLIRSGHPEPALHELRNLSLRFLAEAFDQDRGRFKNFRDIEGRWLDSPGSEDSHGRAMWALGHTVCHAMDIETRKRAYDLFQMGLPGVLALTSPRAWACTLLGLAAVRAVIKNGFAEDALQQDLAARLVRLHAVTATDEWTWFETSLSYDNARLPQALLVTAQQTGNREMRAVGLHTLRWLAECQRAPEKHFRAIGSDGFYRQGDPSPAQWDQQPLEAYAMMAACLEAQRAVGGSVWDHEAQRAHAWFEGGNDLGYPVGNFHTGACFDGVQAHGLNQNCGAESTLAYLQSIAEMKLHRFAPGVPHFEARAS